MPGWRNWQTQRTQNPPVLGTLGVRFPLPAPALFVSVTSVVVPRYPTAFLPFLHDACGVEPHGESQVSIRMYVKVGGRWRYVKPFEGCNHKLKPGFALIGGLETHPPDAAYYIRFREGKKIVWQRCRNVADATLARERQEAYLAAYAHGLTDAQQAKPVPKMVSHRLEGWLEEYRLSHSKES